MLFIYFICDLSKNVWETVSAQLNKTGIQPQIFGRNASSFLICYFLGNETTQKNFFFLSKIFQSFIFLHLVNWYAGGKPANKDFNHLGEK